MQGGKESRLSNHPVVVFVGIVASICGIVGFVLTTVSFMTGKFSFSDFFGKSSTESRSNVNSDSSMTNPAVPVEQSDRPFPSEGYAPRPFKERQPLQPLLETTNAMVGEESGSVGAAVLAAPFGVGGVRAYVSVVIDINGESLLAGKQGPNLPVEISVQAIDQSGSVQDVLTQRVRIDLAKAEPVLWQSGLKFFGHLDLSPGTYSLRTLVRNGTTGAFSLRINRITVPAFSKGEAALLPALFPEPPGRWMMVRETPQAGEPQMPYPFILKDQPYIPSSQPVLAPGQAAAVVLQGYNLVAGDLKAEAQVLSADGQELPGGALDLVGKEGGGAAPLRVTATFQPPELPPGEYVLRVTLTDGADKTETSTARFAVAG
jgi:hypothetical protein